jgi:amino acid transporter
MSQDKKPTVFLREATGLVKRASFLDAISLNISNMSVGAALGVIGYTMTAVNVIGLNLVIASILAFVLSIPQVIVYTMMVKRVPRTGGDYVWVTRTLGGLFGAPLSLMGYPLETMAYMALIVLAGVNAIGSVGLFFGNSSFLGIALPPNLPGANPTEQILIGAFIFIVLILVNIFAPRAGFRLVSVLTLFGIGTLLIAIFSYLIIGRAGIINYMNLLQSLSNANPPVTYQSLSSAYKGPDFDFGATIFMLPFFAIFVFPWLNAGPAVSAEIKGKNAVEWNVPIAAITVFVLVTAAFGAMYYAGGLHFINMALSNPTLVFDWSFNFWTLAMGITNNTFLQYIMGAGWVAWEFAILAYAIIVTSRYIFAQAFDGFLPARFAYVSSRYGSPVNSLAFIAIMVLALSTISAYFYGGFQTLYAATIASMIYFFFVGIAAVIYAQRNEKGGAKGMLSAAGILMAGVFAYIIYDYLANPTIWGTAVTVANIPGTYFAYLYVVGSFIVGLILYDISRIRYSKQGINIELAFKTIPPE